MLRSPTVRGRERQESQGPLEQCDVCSRCGVGRSQGSREEEQSRQQGQEVLPDRNLEGWVGISLGRLGREEICCNFKNQGARGEEGIERCYGKRPEEDKTQLALPNRSQERTCLPWGLRLPRGCLATKRDFLLSTESP